MQWKNDATRYGAVAQILHWSVVGLIAAQFVLASVAEGLPRAPAKIAVLAQHKSIGITVLALVLLRLLWRWVSPAPELPATVQGWSRLAARASHALLYVLIAALPLLGWLMSSSRNFPVSWLGLVTLPDLIAPDRAAYELLHAAHATAANLLLALVLVHAAASLKHHFIDGDDVLRRMLGMKLRQEGKALDD